MKLAEPDKVRNAGIDKSNSPMREPLKARSTAGAVDPSACATLKVKMIWLDACDDCTAEIVAVRFG